MDKTKIKAIQLMGIRARTSNSYGRNLPYMRYRVFLTFTDKGVNVFKPIEEVFSAEELESLSYWSKRSNSMSMTCWGTSQLFEAQISLGRWLGFSTSDWPKFSRRCESFIIAN